MTVVVTGGSGLAGRYIIADLLAHGHPVVNVDTRPDPYSEVSFVRADCTDFGQVVSVLRSAESVIHMAAIPNPVSASEDEVFRINMLSTWNVLEAAEVHGIPRVVLASSINAIGASWSKAAVPPEYFPIDERHPTRVETAYCQSKWFGEEMADAFCRRRQMQIASMRFHALLTEERQKEMQQGPAPEPEEERPKKGFWSWTDCEEAAKACRLAIEKTWTGHERFFINGPDTVLDVPTEEAIERAYPGVPIKKPLPGYASVLDTARAGQVLGWVHEKEWRHGRT